jgi:hypothetical protein
LAAVDAALSLVICTRRPDACAPVCRRSHQRGALRRHVGRSALLPARACPARDDAAAAVAGEPAFDAELAACLRDAGAAGERRDALRRRVGAATTQPGAALAAVGDHASAAVTGRPTLDALSGTRLRLAERSVGPGVFELEDSW